MYIFANLIEYLGYMADDEELRSNSQLVQVLTNFPRSTTLKELQSFLIFANYYRKFISNFSHIVLLLMNATQNATRSNLKSIKWMQSIKPHLTNWRKPWHQHFVWLCLTRMKNSMLLQMHLRMRKQSEQYSLRMIISWHTNRWNWTLISSIIRYMTRRCVQLCMHENDEDFSCWDDASRFIRTTDLLSASKHRAISISVC